MIAAVRSLLADEENSTDEDGTLGDSEPEPDDSGAVVDEDAPTIRGEPVGLDEVVVSVGRSSIYHYPDEDGSAACRPDAEVVEATRRKLEPHYRACRHCFDAPAAER